MAASDLAPFDLAKLFGNVAPPETATDMRRLIDGFGAFINSGLPAVGAFHEGIEVADGVSADVIVPRGAGPFPVLVYLHGGGWICGSPATHRKLAHRFAEAGHLVFNVAYRLAPEHPFPTPFDDCVGAIRWAARNAARFGGDASRLAVGGDSAGGNLAAASAAALHDDPARPKAALLIYGVFDFARLASTAEPATAPTAGISPELGEKMVRLMIDSYLGECPSAAVLADPRVSPLHAADRLPPTHVVCGGADPLVVQARDLAARLARAGIEHECFIDPAMPHGYVQLEFLPPARPAIDRMVAFLRKHV